MQVGELGWGRGMGGGGEQDKGTSGAGAWWEGPPPALALATTPAHCDLPGCAQAFVTGTLEADL